MNKKIIYPHHESGICIILPTGSIPLEEVAKKDVPDGIPYLIIDEDDVPSSRNFRNAWEADFSNPDGYGIGHQKWFEQQKMNEK